RSSSQALTITGSGNLTINGGVSGGNAADTLTYSGTGTLKLGGSDSLTGLTAVSSGLLQLFNVGNLASTDSLTVSGTGSFDINGRNQTLALVTNTSSNSNAITNSSGTSATLTIGDGSTGSGAYTGKMAI